MFVLRSSRYPCAYVQLKIQQWAVQIRPGCIYRAYGDEFLQAHQECTDSCRENWFHTAVKDFDHLQSNKYHVLMTHTDISSSHSTYLLFFALASFIPATFGAPVSGNTKDASPCTNPVIRKEWRTLSQDQRDQFHKAVKCLQDKPSALNVEESRNLYDDFTYVHYTINETTMADCGYSDPMPYWDWTRDSTPETFRNSEIFDNEKGFGDDGTGKTNWTDGLCVEDGPYAGLHVNVPEPHCLTRQFNISEQLMTNWTKSLVDEIMEYPDYLSFWNNTERHPHDNIHRIVGGDLKRQYSSNDPLFFLHHAQVDRLWTLWQGRNETRLHDYAGNTVQNMTANTASLGDEMFTLGFAPERDVQSLMDTMASGLCYTVSDVLSSRKDVTKRHAV
ncbi:Tyrosinase domain-containing protein [Rhizoctonia solani AG-1 IA]|uniref:Tyrosinase domain-containing protein n=1 Tax=Thanatephorus cucumeris (strain AG1-IA) TaxID=983506 RepID=L8WW92_THACA|nr:Tyrosinase domain-containing protein [Rhizoctonia solani AG-1 IA]